MTLTLFTGAPGWLGTRLVQALLEGLPDTPGLTQTEANTCLRCLVQPGVDAAQLPDNQKIELIQGDLRNPVDMETFCRGVAGGLLFHCAGLVHPSKRVGELFQVNVTGTRHLLEAAEKAGVYRAVVVSSNSPIGNNPSKNNLFDENSPYHPYMAYGRSKMQMEQIVHEVQQRGKMETVIIRPPWFYGINQPKRQTTFFRMIRSGGAPILGDGDNRRSMAYIDNLCQGLILASRTPAAAGQTYWVADARPYSMNEIIDTVEDLMEKEFNMSVAHKRMRLPSFASEVAYLADGAIQALGAYQQKIHVLSEMNKTIACSIEKARCELGYNPVIELKEGMRRSIAWCLEQGIEL